MRAQLARVVVGAAAVSVLATAACSTGGIGAPPTFAPQPPPAAGFDAGVMTLGVLVEGSGSAADTDAAALDGVRAYWAGVNSRGGLAQLYPVELEIRDHGADAATAREALRAWDIAAAAYLGAGINAVELTGSSSGDAAASAADSTADVAADPTTGRSLGLPLPVVPAAATIAAEDAPWVLTSTTPVELTTVALLDRFSVTGPGASWCVIVDSSTLGRQAAATAHAIGAARETVPAMLDLDVGEVEVLDLDASVVHVADAVADRRCRFVLVEVAAARAAGVLEQIPADLTVVRRATLAPELVLPANVELLFDAAPPWSAGQSGVMDAFVADWTSFGPDREPDARSRAGWMSQLRLHELLERALAEGDVSRDRLLTLAPHVEPIDPDRNTLPGVPRVGMDISDVVGGGPLRTLRLYGRADFGADELGLLQVRVEDVTPYVEELRARLDACAGG